jgi:hypothetical protein
MDDSEHDVLVYMAVPEQHMDFDVLSIEDVSDGCGASLSPVKVANIPPLRPRLAE